MILLEKRSHLFLKVPLAVVRFLFFDVSNQCPHVGGAHGECAGSALPCEVRNALSFHPIRRDDFEFLGQLRKALRRVKTHCQMDVVGRTTGAEALALFVADDGGEVGVEVGPDVLMNESAAVFGAEDEMNQVEAQRLGRAENYKSGLQPSGAFRRLTWGFAPGWYQTAPLALILASLLSAAGCKSSPPPAKPTTVVATEYHYAPRPTVPPPPVKVFHQDEDTYTLVTKENATDDEIAAILWQFRDAAQHRSFDALHLSEKFVDARKPTVWFHVYRGTKCASEKFVKGKYPCGAKYNGAGDYTLGAYKNPLWDDAILHHPDGSETHLWDPDAPAKS